MNRTLYGKPPKMACREGRNSCRTGLPVQQSKFADPIPRTDDGQPSLSPTKVLYTNPESSLFHKVASVDWRIAPKQYFIFS